MIDPKSWRVVIPIVVWVNEVVFFPCSGGRWDGDCSFYFQAVFLWRLHCVRLPFFFLELVPFFAFSNASTFSLALPRGPFYVDQFFMA